MFIYLYVFVTVAISIAAYETERYGLALFELVFTFIGIFIHQNQDHPAVREWIEKYF